MGLGGLIQSSLMGLGGLFQTGLMGLGSLFQSGLQGLGSLFGGGGGGGGLLSSLFSIGSSLFGFQDGGLVRGPGTGRSDSILARISNGEYVVNAAATRRYRPILEAINSGRIPRFQDGGFVGDDNASRIGGTNNVVVNLQVTTIQTPVSYTHLTLPTNREV